MRVACVIMQRREAGGLEPWPRYHGYLFGYSGLFVMEPLSDDPAVSSPLRRFDQSGLFDIPIPLDGDAFIAICEGERTLRRLT
jgi:hypothetical protein